jgi:hypothetical protein
MPWLSARGGTVTEEQAVRIGAILLGLVSCYWTGFKFGKVVRIIKNLGNSA